MPKIKDLTGQKYNRLTVIKFSHQLNHKSQWLCQCDCGKETIVDGYKLKKGITKSCGCYASERAREWMKEMRAEGLTQPRITHGLSNLTIYNSWKTMLHRCENKNDKRYHDYGGRGIKVCDEWHDVTKFYQWAVQNGYEEGLSIDRIDVNGNYEPSNCRWADRVMQQNNMRNNVLLTINGKTKTLMTWAREYGIRYDVLISRLRRGWDEYEAVTFPVNKTRKYIHQKTS
jgi:hypothetical protein